MLYAHAEQSQHEQPSRVRHSSDLGEGALPGADDDLGLGLVPVEPEHLLGVPVVLVQVLLTHQLHDRLERLHSASTCHVCST